MDRDKASLLLMPQGRELEPGPGESLLDTALRAGINLPHSCRSGNCGACSAQLLSGRVEYPDGPPPGLSPEEQASGRVLLCKARAVGRVAVESAEIARAGQVQVKRLPCRVQSLTMLCHDVVRLGLRLPAVEPLDYLPGQYVDLLLPGGKRRSFSIANAPGDGRYLELQVRRVPGGEFTDRTLAGLAPGAVLRLEGPLGSFVPRKSGRPWLMVAGGTGLAPLKCMLDDALARGEQRPVRLFWGVRSQRDLYAPQLMEHYRQAFGDFRWVPVLSEPDPGWEGAAGLVHEAVIATVADLWAHDIYVAGPPGLVSAARRDFPGAGANPVTLFFDSFDYAPDVTGRWPDPAG